MSIETFPENVKRMFSTQLSIEFKGRYHVIIMVFNMLFQLNIVYSKYMFHTSNVFFPLVISLLVKLKEFKN